MTPPTRLLVASALAAAAILPAAGHAACSDKNFGLSLNVISTNGTDTGQRCEDTAEDFFDLLNDATFQQLVPSYTDIAFAEANIDFNGVPVTLQFDFESTVLNFSIPALGISEAFAGTTRDESADLLVEYLKKSGVMSEIIKYQAEHSATSPIAGPGGLIPSAAAADFDAAMSDTLREIGGSNADSPTFSIGASYGSMTVDGRDGEVTNLPFSRVWRSDSTPGQMFTLSGSLTLVKIGGAEAYHGGVGAAFRMPVTSRWALTPSLRYAVTGSADLASVAGMYSAGVSSTYHIPLDGLDLVIGNMAGYYKTTKLSVGDYSFDPKIKTWSLRNGVMLAQPVKLMGLPLSLEYSLVDTRYTGGTEFFVDNTQEIGISIGTNRGGDVAKSYARFGLRYLHGRETNSITLSGSYWF